MAAGSADQWRPAGAAPVLSVTSKLAWWHSTEMAISIMSLARGDDGVVTTPYRPRSPARRRPGGSSNYR